MGQDKRFAFNNNSNYSFDKVERNQTINKDMEDISIVFVMQNSMGSNTTYSPAEHSKSTRNFLTFFNRLGNYNVYNLLPQTKTMAAIIIKLWIILANCFGLYLFFYWLFIDFAGIKVFLTSVAVFIYGGMKLYEKYLDIKEKKRKQDDYDEKHKDHLHKK